MYGAGFGPAKNRAGIYVRQDRRIVDAQHFNVTRAATTPSGSPTPFDDHPPVSLDRDFGPRSHEVSFPSKHGPAREVKCVDERAPPARRSTWRTATSVTSSK